MSGTRKTFNHAFNEALDEVMLKIPFRRRGLVRLYVWFNKNKMKIDAYGVCCEEVEGFENGGYAETSVVSDDIWTQLLEILLELLMEWLENWLD